MIGGLLGKYKRAIMTCFKAEMQKQKTLVSSCFGKGSNLVPLEQKQVATITSFLQSNSQISS